MERKISFPQLGKRGDVVASGIQNFGSSLSNEIKKVTDKKITVELPDIETIKGSGSGYINFLGETYDSMLDFENRTAEFGSVINDNLGPAKLGFTDLQASVAENIIGLQESFTALSDFGNFLGDSIKLAFDSAVNTIADSFSAMGEAMATGGDVLGSFGQTILSGIGSFLGALGKQMIQYGVAALAMAVLSKMLLNPITAVPAALGMIAAGAALSLISGAISGTLKGGSSGGGGSVPSGGGSGSQSYSSSFSGGSGSGEVVFRISGNDLVGVLSRQQDKNTRLGG